jgi:uracil-DNA glycosylase
VLLLNTCLTVRRGEANSHQKQGWELFTDAVVRELSKKEGLVYLLWGKPAQTKYVYRSFILRFNDVQCFQV